MSRGATVDTVVASLVSVPLSRPMRTATFEIPAIDTALVQVRTADGCEGVGWSFGFGKGRVASVVRMIEALGEALVGSDPRETESLWRRLSNLTAFTGRKGVGALALAALDTACWDLAGKLAGLPVYRMLGGSAAPVETYASEGLWLDRGLDELVAEAAALVQRGFRAVKMRAGLPDEDDDIARIAAVREAIGSGTKLMVDVNQGWDVPTTIRMARRMEPYDIFWLEEPVPADRYDWYRSLTSRTAVPLCTGESNYFTDEIVALVEEPSVDYVMLDLMRMAGVTEWLKAARVCEAYGRPLSPHLFMEQSVHLAAASTNCVWQEHMPWWEPILRQPVDLREGRIHLSESPGFGVELDDAAVARYRAG